MDPRIEGQSDVTGVLVADLPSPMDALASPITASECPANPNTKNSSEPTSSSPITTALVPQQLPFVPPSIPMGTIERSIGLPFVGGGPLEDQILQLHLCLDNSDGGEAYGGVVKVVGRVQSTLKAAGKKERELFLSYLASKESTLIPSFMACIETSTDPAVVGAICELVHDCLAPNSEGATREQLIRTLTCNYAAESLFRSFRGFSAVTFSKPEFGLLHGFQIIAKLASKDPKLAIKCRLVGGVKFTHQLIQTHSKNNQLLLPLLLILKFIAKNPTNQVVLGKDGCVTTLVGILTSVPKTHWAKIKLVLENLALLTKTTLVSPRLSATIRAGGTKLQALLNFFFESNVIRLVRESGLSKVLSLLDSWDKIEKKHQTKVIRALLYVLLHLCDSKHGRKAVLSLKGDDTLHRFVTSCPSDPRFDLLLGVALNVFLKCSSKGELPVMSLKGAITFDGPTSRESSPNAHSDSRDTTPDDPSQDSSDEEEGNDYGEEEDGEGRGAVNLTTSYNPQTTRIEDLMRVAVFFPELKENPARDEGANKKDQPLSGPDLYLHMSSSTKSLIHLVKVAYPDLVGAQGPDVLEPFYKKNSRVIRDKALRTVDRILNANHYQEKVVFDLDFLLESDSTRQMITPVTPTCRPLSNWDEKRVGKKDVSANHLNFESRFESGNLRRAIQIAPYEYDLVLNSDVNSWHHHQWFYFEISNMEAATPYIINIINNEKPNSEFNFGMKPVIFSVKEALQGRGAWVRTGYDICYHKNHFVRMPKSAENHKFRKGTGKSYYTASMTVEFPHANDVVYLAYHYPYTFTKLQAFLSTVGSDACPLPGDTFYRNQTLCHTLNGNPVPLLTITSTDTPVKEKEVVFLTARVHPGETNASWVIQGTITFLLGASEEARALRNGFIFKIVPMLNPEGVIHGNQRCGLTDEDLNRRWRAPSPLQHPTIYYTKALIEHLTAVVGKRPLIFCDFHGHSRQKNVFMYGCSRQQSWWHQDREMPEEGHFMVLPRLAQLHMRTFSLGDCRFDVERAREATARVAVWRQFHVKHSYTMEASTCGCDRGPYKNHHLSPRLLLETGEGFCLALFHFGCKDHANHKTIVNNRLAWMGAIPSSEPEEPEDIAEVDLDLDSEDDLDFELYGMTRRSCANVE